jgi:transcriptional regulator with XRE-family HTH domain
METSDPLSIAEKLTSQLGNRLRLARLRRRFSMVQVAERANISRQTLGHLESGDTGTSLGVLMRVLKVLSLDKDVDAVAKDDVLGRKLQDLELNTPRQRAPRIAI